MLWPKSRTLTPRAAVVVPSADFTSFPPFVLSSYSLQLVGTGMSGFFRHRDFAKISTGYDASLCLPQATIAMSPAAFD